MRVAETASRIRCHESIRCRISRPAQVYCLPDHVQCQADRDRLVPGSRQAVRPVARRIQDLGDHSTGRDLEDIVTSGAGHEGVTEAIHHDADRLEQSECTVSRPVDDLCDDATGRDPEGVVAVVSGDVDAGRSIDGADVLGLSR